MKKVIYSMLGAGLLCLSSCGGQTQTEQTPAVDKSSAKNQVTECAKISAAAGKP